MGFVWACAALLLPSFTLASSHAWAAPYSDIVIDANSGNVLHETNPNGAGTPRR